MKRVLAGLFGAAAIAATILLVRQQKLGDEGQPRVIPAGESQPAAISLDRIRELGM